MASNNGTHVFNNKETNNWFKACIALNFTKEGLTNLVDTELQNVLKTVGTSCGNCSIERILPCPTQGLCKKRKGNVCTFHLTQPTQYCQTCDSVKRNIILLHRFGGPSWKNTKAQLWQTNYWEIGKCFLPPDGYSCVTSIWQADINGIVSVLLNCKHFETCLSSSLSPKPPDPKCPLEKVRQISRDIRHTADCKVSDANLQDYFHTLSNLLADPIRLLHNPTAANARTKLRDLQNDHLSLKELGELLKEAYQTLKNMTDTGKQLSDEATRTLTEGLQRLDDQVIAGEKSIESTVHGQICEAIKDIVQKTNESIDTMFKTTQVCKQDIENKARTTELNITNKLQEVNTQIELTTKNSVETIKDLAQHVVTCSQQSNDARADGDYERDSIDLLNRLREHYDNLTTLTHVSLSPLNASDDACLKDVYTTPKILVMTKKMEFSRKEMQLKNTKQYS